MATDRERKKHRHFHLNTVIAVLVIGITIGAAAVLYHKSISLLQPAVERDPVEITGVARAIANIVAIAGEDGQGIMGTASVELRSGEGRILISTNPFVEPDTQDSIKTAKSVAEDVLGVSLARSDVIVSFGLGLETNETQIVGGPSAGAAIAVAIIAAVQGKTVRSDVAFTGTVEPDGKIGRVSAVLEKAEAAGKAGMKLFMVPGSQGNLTFYEKEVVKETVGNFAIQRIRYFPRTVSLTEYTQQWDMTTVEVATVAEAARLSIIGFESPEAGRIGVTG